MIDFLLVVLAYEVVILLTFGSQYRLYRWLWLKVESGLALLLRALRRLGLGNRPIKGEDPVPPVQPSLALRVAPPQALMVREGTVKETKPEEVHAAQ